MNHGAYNPPAHFHNVQRQYAEQTPLLASNRAQGAPPSNLGFESALSTPLSPMFSPLGSARSSHSDSAMSSRPYNPQRWGLNSNTRGAHLTFPPNQTAARESTGMEPFMPSPPPPYTPPPDGVSRLMRPGNITILPSPLSIEPPVSGSTSQRSTPSNGPSVHFAPPPPSSYSRDRSASGTGREVQRSRFSIAGLAARVKRTDSSEQLSDLSLLQPQTTHTSRDMVSQPPAARRAVSTGAITAYVARPSLAGRISPEASHWEPGMPLPPPPPGPPPSGSPSINHRSQSLNRYANQTCESHETIPSFPRGTQLSSPPQPLTRKRHENVLGAIPPTPSDWTPDGSSQLSDRLNTRVETDTHGSGIVGGVIPSHAPMSLDVSTNSIRERRSRSRAQRDGQDIVVPSGDSGTLASSSSESKRPINLTLATSADALSRRRLIAAVESSSSQSSPAQSASPAHARRQIHGRNKLTVLTPPYTPSTVAPFQSGALNTGSSQVEHSPSQRDQHGKPASQLVTEAGHTDAGGVLTLGEYSVFAQSSLERYRIFVHQEATAHSDRERLELFANYMVQESRIRRGRYSEAFKTMAGDIMELTRDMWRPLPTIESSGTPALRSRNISPESGNIAVDLGDSFHTSAASTAELTPATDSESLADGDDNVPSGRPPNHWGDKFQPCLSPIPSMAVSTVPDEEGSRGRSASRWWEDSIDGSMGNGGHRLGRTRQEAKYMSLHPQELYGAAQASPNSSMPTPGTSKVVLQYGPDEYPAEKVTWCEDERQHTPHHSAALLSLRNKTPISHLVKKSAMNVTRLVTLPPPYPRHYPAVNNSHPALSTLRANHRAVADLSSIRELVQAHESAETSRRQAWRTLAGDRLRHFRSQTQASINMGKMSYNDATQAEQSFRESEAANVLKQAETQSHDFQHKVFEAVHGMLAERLQSCDRCIEQLTEALEAEARGDQNLLAQTEGDERPELVEQLTLLKWLFESREHIYKERFDMDTALLARESAIILTKHRQTRGDAQVHQIERHFETERQQRQLQYTQDTTKRFDRLRKTVERHISRGVEIQLSAFWDIAPGLVEIVHKVPRDLQGFEIEVPAIELAENVSYREFPLQYMFTILVHAKKSAYQFIEAQTNLLCLLHEVHTATESTWLRLQEVERSMAGEMADEVQTSMMQIKKEKEQELTQDLQDKVREVESQWREALGTAMEECIDRLRSWLQESGGWEESLETY